MPKFLAIRATLHNCHTNIAHQCRPVIEIADSHHHHAKSSSVIITCSCTYYDFQFFCRIQYFGINNITADNDCVNVLYSYGYRLLQLLQTACLLLLILSWSYCIKKVHHRLSRIITDSIYCSYLCNSYNLW